MPVRTLILLLSLVGMSGCQATEHVYNGASVSDRDTNRAEQLTRRAVDLLPDNMDDAERLLREALAADLYHGPAHNNLGAIFLEQGRLYEAAHEFEWARKLMPGHPDPRMNLALALERAGQVEAAIDAYHSALSVYPGHLPTLQALCRLQVRYDIADDELRDRLEIIAMRSGQPEWQDWARRQMIALSAKQDS